MTAAFAAAIGEAAAENNKRGASSNQGRPLTDEERELARTSFVATHGSDEGFNYDSVRIINDKFVFTQANNFAVTPNGKIYYPGACSNMATCGESSSALFVHEVEHVWQYQHGENFLMKGLVLQAAKYLSFKSYDPYILPLGTPYAKLNIEAQTQFATCQLYPNYVDTR